VRLCMGVHVCNARIHEQVYVCGRGRKCACVHACMRSCVHVYVHPGPRPNNLSFALSLWRLCWQMLAPPQSLQMLLQRLCSQMPVDAPAVLAVPRLCCQMHFRCYGGHAGRCRRPRSPAGALERKETRNFKNIDGLWFRV